VLGIQKVHHSVIETVNSRTTSIFAANSSASFDKCDQLRCCVPIHWQFFFGEHYYNHRDHRVVGFGALDAASPAAASPHYFPEQGAPFQIEVAYLSGSLEPNVLLTSRLPSSGKPMR